MSRHNDQRLTDILAAAEAINDHMSRGSIDDGLVFDAIPRCWRKNPPFRG